MKMFISWSKERSLHVARALNDWIPRVIQKVEPWLSEEIPKGVRWNSEVAKELDNSNFGIVCVTPENQAEPWLNFEAGALAKSVNNTYVCTYLIDLKPTDVLGPLKDFQHTRMDQEDTFRLMKTLNASQGEGVLAEKRLEETLAVWWPRLEEQLKKLPPSKTPAPKGRDQESMIEEILDTVRKLDRRESSGFADHIEHILPNVLEANRTFQAWKYPAIAERLNKAPSLPIPTNETEDNTAQPNAKRRKKK